MILGFVFALVVAAPQHRSSTESQATMQQGAHDEYERHKQAAIRGLAEGRWVRMELVAPAGAHLAQVQSTIATFLGHRPKLGSAPDVANLTSACQ
jgi:hypothetical protein